MLAAMKNQLRPQVPRNHLKRLRSQAGMSQYDVERVTGISQSRLSLLERAIRPMSAADADVLARALAVSADQLIDRDHAA